MKKLNILFALFLAVTSIFTITGCDPANKALSSRELAPVPVPETRKDGKPDPDGLDKEEDFKTLSLQDSTGDVEKYENVMNLDLTKHAQAWFSFTFSPKTDGFLFFNIKNLKLTLKCTGEGSKIFSRRVFWQEYSSSTRRVISEMVQSKASFEFEAGKNYVLSYVLTDVRKDFPKCQNATVRMAIFE
ncbi:MAG: hypothetical protein H7326_06630 [Bdellovibrionaceae bacterium]|nr:hypothetical protein [Pseudobdellovibrionaceae bacterium]